MSTAAEKYRVVVTREGKDWLADVPDLEGAHTFARTLGKLDRYVREVVSLVEDLPVSAMPKLVLEYEFQLGSDELDADTAEVRKLKAAIDELEERRSRLTAKSADALTARGIGVRDAAKLLDVSHQWISQLTNRVHSG